MKQLIKIFVILIVSISLVATQGICADQKKGNNGKKDQIKTKPHNNKPLKPQKPLKTKKPKNHKKKDKNRSNRPERAIKIHDGSPGSVIKEEKLAKLIRKQRHDKPKGTQKEKIARFKEVLKSMGKSRWAHNPKDDRGQGNMGKPDMLDPFGQDKDSDRKELYGSNGRRIKPQKNDDGSGDNDQEPPIVEPPEPPPLEANIDFTSIDEMEWLVNWYESTLSTYYLDPTAQRNHTYEEWTAMWYEHFFPGGDMEMATGIRLNVPGDTSEKYSYDIALNNFTGDLVEVTTQIVLSEDHTTTKQYDETTGTWREETINLQAGEVVFEQTEPLTVDPETGLLSIGIPATNDIIGDATDEAYIDLIVTITDPATGSTYTQSYDKALYLYRCPYGKIFDSKTNRPIVNAKVTVHFEDGSIVPLDRASNPTASNPQTTDATGRYGFKLETNRKYYMTATAEGFEDYKSPVFTEKWHVLREDIALTAKTEETLIGQK